MNILTNETNKATIVDVANMSGVSIKTVSRVANGEPHVRDKTRAKVQRAIDLLGYSANPYAKQMGAQSRPPVPARRRNVITSRQETTLIENEVQSEDQTASLASAHLQSKAAVSAGDRDIDWW